MNLFLDRPGTHHAENGHRSIDGHPLNHRFAWVMLALTVGGASVAGGCSSNGDPDGGSGSSGSNTGNSGSGNEGGGIKLDGVGGGGGASGDGDGDGGPVCESSSSEARLVPVYLAFAFDVSGSMGKIEDSGCFDPEFKWKPVVEATSAFFSAESSKGLHASMALFPARDDKCDASSYEDPEVALQELPSAEFAAALSDYEAEVEEDEWRGGTPTLAAYSGTLSSLDGARSDDPSARFAVILVTDGKPQGCDDNDITPIEDAVAAAEAAGVSTYVIGVKQPTGQPDCSASAENDELLANLDTLAQAGGTDAPFMIDTGNTAATQLALDAAIQSIRSRAVSCEVAIPPHPKGGQFEKDKVDVSVSEGGTATPLGYDAECETASGWRYDNAAAPTMIELCDSSCGMIQTSPGAELNVNFLCEPRPDTIK